MFFGAVVCFVAGVKIALLAGLVSFGIGSMLGWALARINVETGLSTPDHASTAGWRGSALLRSSSVSSSVSWRSRTACSIEASCFS
jgi:hypothetical protein